jgi:hypothetical protein
LEALREQLARGEASDGYHTHRELYEYRMLYNAHAARGWLASGYPVVKSWRHSDGERCFGGGWFIVVASLPTGQVSNHYSEEHWSLFDVPEVARPPEYDGHTPADAAERLRCALASPPAPVEERQSCGDQDCDHGILRTFDPRTDGKPCEECARLNAPAAVEGEREEIDWPAPGERWRHAKGGEYEAIGVGQWEPDTSLAVLYRSVRTGELWARPLKAWREEYAPGVPRFTRLASHPVQGAGGGERDGFPLRMHADERANPLDRWCSADRFEAMEGVVISAAKLFPDDPDRDDYTAGEVELMTALADLDAIERRDFDAAASPGDGERAALAKISRIIAGVEPGLYQPDPYKRLKLVQNIALPYGLAAMHGSAPPSSVAGNAARDLVVRVACGLADNAPWRQSPDMDILKDVVSKYRAASPAPSLLDNEEVDSQVAPSAPEKERHG